MKICPICEKKIEGRFCTHCFRFVTPWTVSDNTYINKGHDSRRDKECDYHNPKTQYSRQEYMKPGYEKRVYGGTGTQTAQNRKQTKPAAKNGKNASDGKTSDAGKQLKAGLFICIFLLVIGAIAAFVEMGYIKLSDFSRTTEPIPEAYSVDADATEPESSFDDSRSIKGYLQAISFVDKKESYLGDYYYYDPDDIVGLTEYHCDSGHFDLLADELYDRFVSFYGEEPLETDMVRKSENNYMLDAVAGADTILLETEYQWTFDTFDMEVLADTASDEVHGYSFTAANADDVFYDMIYRWCSEEFPGQFHSVEDLKKTLSSNGGYLSQSLRDDIRMKGFQMGNYVSVEFKK